MNTLRGKMDIFRTLLIRLIAKLIPLATQALSYSPKLRDLVMQSLALSGDDKHVKALVSAEGNDQQMLRDGLIIKSSLSGIVYADLWRKLTIVLVSTSDFQETDLESQTKRLREHFPENDIKYLNHAGELSMEQLTAHMIESAGNFPVCFVRANSSGAERMLKKFLQTAIQKQVSILHFGGASRVTSDSKLDAIYLTRNFHKSITLDLPDLPFETFASLYKSLRWAFYPIERIVEVTESELAEPNPEQTILFVQPLAGGGVKKISDAIIKKISESARVLVLEANPKTFSVFEVNGDERTLKYTAGIQHRVEAYSHTSIEYDGYFQEVIVRFGVTAVHVEHLTWQSLSAFAICEPMGINLTHTVHDFYDICIRYTLLDETLLPCFGVCSTTVGTCESPLWPSFSTPNLKHDKVHAFRKQMEVFLGMCDTLVYPDRTVLSQMKEIYGDKLPKAAIVPNALLVDQSLIQKRDKHKGDKIRVLVLGDLSLIKGALKIKEISGSDDKSELDFHFVGRPWPGLRGIGKHYGSYTHENLSRLVQEIRPTIAILPGPFFETFSLTLSELWSMGVPTIVSDHGALGSRTRDSGCGITVPFDASGKTWLVEITNFAGNENVYAQVIERIRIWQSRHSPEGDLQAMAEALTKIFFKLPSPKNRN